ncbi:MAG: BrnA antitoxin family protein [Chloroflexi bacterium]|nr:BrnA antitoxin family protein [Chloroflexota bacterium]
MEEKQSRIPHFKNEDEEREFWARHNVLDYPDEFEEVKGPIIVTRPRKKQITFRIEEDAIERIRKLAARKGMGWQTLMRALIYEGLEDGEKRAG